MAVPEEVVDLLADLREHLQDKCEPPVYVSDRRLVKAVALMQARPPLSPTPASHPERFAQAGLPASLAVARLVGSPAPSAPSWPPGTCCLQDRLSSVGAQEQCSF